MKIVVMASLAYSLTNFRGALLEAMVRCGHEVVACAPEDDPEVTRQLAALGVRYERVEMERTKLNPFGDLGTIGAYMRLLKAERPDVVLAYTQKPIVYGGIATRLAGGATRFHAMVSGLGYVFTDHDSKLLPLLRWVVSILYRFGIRKAKTVFVFNSDDKAEMLRHGILVDQPVVQVPGSGIDTTSFVAQPIPEGPPVFLLIARLLKDKGLLEFVEAARHIRARHPDARFQILGPLDPNPSGITREQVDAWAEKGIVEYLGETRDVKPYLAAASVFVLPTWYREGLPRTILEAMATGRPIITTDAPGCRETVEVGENGFLVPVRNANALADAMTRFVKDPALAPRMGRRSRALAESRFDVTIVNAILLRTMGLVDPPAASGTASRGAPVPALDPA